MMNPLRCSWSLGVPVFPVTGTNVSHGKVMMRFFAAHVVCDNDQKSVTSQVIPAITAVHGFAHVLKIFPADDRILQVIACTCIPEITTHASEELVFGLV